MTVTGDKKKSAATETGDTEPNIGEDNGAGAFDVQSVEYVYIASTAQYPPNGNAWIGPVLGSDTVTTSGFPT